MLTVFTRKFSVTLDIKSYYQSIRSWGNVPSKYLPNPLQPYIEKLRNKLPRRRARIALEVVDGWRGFRSKPGGRYVKTTADFKFLLAPLVGHTLKLSCGHTIKVTRNGFQDTIVIWQIGKKLMLMCHNCAY
ncbi:MAG: hypothetical protein AB9866_18890 [Syntrophobacteraceae bacterium]